MNAGGRYGEFGDVVQEVDLLRPDGHLETWSRAQLGFSYRASAIQDEIVLSVRLELAEDDPVQVGHRFDECFECKTRTQPLTERSAGCIFKNPPGQSAGALIDQAGLKGAKCGGARVSERHANFIVAEGGATASDVIRLMNLIRERVQRVFGTELQIEVEIW